MVRLVGVCLALVVGKSAYADPGAPQLSPLRRQREDAQRLREQRGLQRERPPEPVPAQAAAPAGADKGLGVPTHRGTALGGVALLGVAGVSGLIALALLTTPSTDGAGSDSDWTAFLGATAAVTGVAGFALVVSSRRVQVAPAVTPKAAGIAIATHW